ncbi:hypothetical protein MTR_1g115465 [Medicago truncatula]|uniref:Uncharacterized protein n=1 Tax=Medicago truncatula TaxID=3880 RepID=A0A072VSU4_MEDTR|nr:hypothetical protein MTR_1g115465 [Medicago truncatula]
MSTNSWSFTTVAKGKVDMWRRISTTGFDVSAKRTFSFFVSMISVMVNLDLEEEGIVTHFNTID